MCTWYVWLELVCVIGGSKERFVSRSWSSSPMEGAVALLCAQREAWAMCMKAGHECVSSARIRQGMQRLSDLSEEDRGRLKRSIKEHSKELQRELTLSNGT